MPISKNRKGHAKKALARKISERNRKAHLENMYRDMMEQLKDKNSTMTEMLNKEEAMTLPGGPDQTLGRMTSGYINTLTPEEQAEQDRVQAEAILTTNATEDTEYTIIEN